MAKINKNAVKTIAAIAAISGGAAAAEKLGAFEDSRFQVDSSPKIERQLKRTIKPEMKKLGGLTLRLARKTEGQDYKDGEEYDPRSRTVTVSAEGVNDSGSSSVRAIFDAEPGTQQPDASQVRSIEVSTSASDVGGVSSLELAAPGAESNDPGEDLAHTPTSVYSANSAGGSDISGPYLFSTRDNKHFIDGGWSNYTHDPVPTAKYIVANNDEGATDAIHQAFEQPPQ